jgi:hypothetical protein
MTILTPCAPNSVNVFEASRQTDQANSPKIFGAPKQVYSAGSTLLRLVKLDDALRSQRQKTLESLTKIWEQGLKTKAGSLNEDLHGIKEKLKAFPSRVQAVFTPGLESIQTVEELIKCSRRFFKDVKSCLIEPLKKSHRGINGPTFLVSYPRLDKSFTHVQLNNSVIKWTSWNELPQTSSKRNS